MSKFTGRCGKVYYNTRKDAKKAVRIYKHKPFKERKPQRVYNCPTCGGFHITTQSFNKFNKARYRRNNGI